VARELSDEKFWMEIKKGRQKLEKMTEKFQSDRLVERVKAIGIHRLILLKKSIW
jgi:hypothetical protein